MGLYDDIRLDNPRQGNRFLRERNIFERIWFKLTWGGPGTLNQEEFEIIKRHHEDWLDYEHGSYSVDVYKLNYPIVFIIGVILGLIFMHSTNP